MGLCLPVAMAAIWALQVIHPVIPELPPPPRVGQYAPLRVLPEIDILPERPEDSHRTAAPRLSTPSADFVVVDLDYAEDPRREPRPMLAPFVVEAKEKKPHPVPSVEDRVMEAVRTTGHPVLAQVDQQLIYWQRPVYPPQAVEAGIEGDVEVLMLIDIRGRVSRVEVLNPDQYPLLEAAVKQAVSKSVFRTYFVNGRPTPFWVRVPVEFRIVN